jgi:predicted DNA-binding transcriptional regulator YafY
MSQLNILRRHLTMLRLVQPPFSYPSKANILDRLRQEDLECVSERTFERDVKEIESYYGIKVKHCRRHRGYYLYQPEDEDLSNFRQFFELLERNERLAFITHSSDALSASKYLLLDENQAQQDLQHLPLIWNALRMQRKVTFDYQAFHAHLPKRYQVDPLVLLEYNNRWYLAAWDEHDQRFKTFGLERMQKSQLTQLAVEQDRRAQFLALKQDGLGVYIGSDLTVEQVVLHIDKSMAPYIRTLPIHRSQKIQAESKEHLTISMQIIINPELESVILSFGEYVEVLQPISLRNKIRERVKILGKNYS